MKTRLAATAAALLMTFGATACSNDADLSNTDKGSATTTAGAGAGLPTGVNAADVAFAQKMIPHHQQAVEMSKAVLDRGKNTEVRQLAEQIAGAQDPEVNTMKGWLTSWGQPPADSTMGTDHSMGGTDSMDGMMSSDEMTSLNSASGAALDALYVELMIKHHQGAIAMAETQVSSGTDPGAVALARTIIAAQEGEITTMNALLPTLASG